MPRDKTKRLSCTQQDENDSTTSVPKKRSTKTSIDIIPCNFLIEDDGNLEKYKTSWLNRQDYSDSNVSICGQPFQHGECKPFLENEEFLEEFLEKLNTFEFHEKASDLFQFRQSNDLKSYVDPHIYKIMEYLSAKMLPWLKSVTGIPLNGSIDLFLSDYKKNDFLLCHDDELDSRRIAFILYLTKSWKHEFGGNLEFFSATKEIHPDKVVKSITPELNKFAFFSVGATSFHQVSEITEGGVKRIALSGWFYGDPVPRPKIEFPMDEGYLLNDYALSCPDIIAQFCSESYMQESTIQDINEQIADESQVLIPGFLQDDLYKSICKDIVDQDVTFGKFVRVGSPNAFKFQEMCKGPPIPVPTCKDDEPSALGFPKNIQGLQRFFHSHEFMKLMEKMTELPFTSSKLLRVSTSLRKYAQGSYSLLRSGGAKQTGDVEDKIVKNNEEETVQHTDDDEDESEDPNLVDIIYFFASKWDEAWGGLTIYSTEDGEQLITISPEGNCLALVVRNSSVNSYVNYINSNAGEEVYFVYTMTCALDGSL